MKCSLRTRLFVLHGCVIFSLLCSREGSICMAQTGNTATDKTEANATHEPTLRLLQIPVSNPQPSQEPLSSEATEFLRGIILLLLPETFRDDDGWGNQTRIQSGLNVDISKGKLHTSRRWKEVNHGSWSQLTAQLTDPANTFQLSIALIPETDTNPVAKGSLSTPTSVGSAVVDNPPDAFTRYVVTCDAAIRAVGQQQQWSYGLMLWSISADVDVRATFTTKVRVQRSTLTDGGNIRIAINPHVESAHVQLTHFQVNRISHTKGTIAREFGAAFSPVAKRLVRKANEGLADKINRRLIKAKDRFQLPIWKSIFTLPSVATDNLQTDPIPR